MFLGKRAFWAIVLCALAMTLAACSTSPQGESRSASRNQGGDNWVPMGYRSNK